MIFFDAGHLIIYTFFGSRDCLVFIFNKSSPSKSCSLDPIPTSLLKECVNELSPIIARIVNLSLETGTFPSLYKKAIVRPLIKKPSLERKLSNYRPVSNLSFVSKIIEEAVSRQTTNHLKINCLNERMQSAYKKNHSTETAMISVLNNILNQLDKPNTAVLLANLDMSAAFDTVNHQVLFRRLQSTFGIHDMALKWFKSYLHKRKVCVKIEGEESDTIELDLSLPQGSKLGPRLYSDYTQPMGSLLRILILLYHCYADDTSLAKSMRIDSKDTQIESAKSLANSIEKIEKWTRDNKLKLNPDKTEFMVIASTKNRSKIHVSTLDLPNNPISTTPVSKSLGVSLDSSLSMENHISNVCKVCYFYIRWIRSIRPFISIEQTKSLIQMLVICRIDYCNSLFVGLPNVLLARLERIMKVSARLIFKQPPPAPALTS